MTARLLRAQLDGYLQRVVEHDVEESGLRVRRPDTLRRWLTAYAAATATTASYERIRDAATSGVGDKPARTTTGPYVEVLERLWILDRVDAWSPARTPLSRLPHLQSITSSIRTVGQAARCRRRCAARRTRAQLARIAGDDDAGQFPWLRDQLGEDLLDAAIITTGPDAYRRPDGIAVVPAALLGP